jgi:streptomycin 6-kinase
MRRDVAEQALAALNDASLKMNLTLMLIMEECSDEEFRKYRRGTGRAMGYLYTDVIMLIEKEHPDLEPEEMRERGPDDYPGPLRAEQRTVARQPDEPGSKMKRHVAEQALPALFEAAAEMKSTLLLIQKECSEQEFLAYREGMELAMGYLYREIIDPILREHPDLTPEGMK